MLRLRKLCILTAALATASALVTAPAAAQESPADPVSAESQFVNLVNAARAQAGLAALQTDSRLTQLARTHSQSMAEQQTIFHNPNLGSQAPSEWRLLGENVGLGSSVEIVHQALMDSPNHRRNIEGAFERIGVGVAVRDGSVYVTQVFMAVRPASTPAVTPARSTPVVSTPKPRAPKRPARRAHAARIRIVRF